MSDSIQVGDWVVVLHYQHRGFAYFSRPARVIKTKGDKARVKWAYWDQWHCYEEIRKASPLELLAGEAE